METIFQNGRLKIKSNQSSTPKNIQQFDLRKLSVLTSSLNSFSGVLSCRDARRKVGLSRGLI
jgi:hypothetical protein